MMNDDDKLIKCHLYLNKLIEFKDTEPVKVITGIRRCGKSSLLKLMQSHLLDIGIANDHIIVINFESFEFQEMSYKDLYAYVSERILDNKRYYLFLDELHRINQ